MGHGEEIDPMWFLLFVIQFKFPSEQRSHLRFIYLTPLLPHDVVFSHIPLLLPLQNYESRCLANIRQTRGLLNSVLTPPLLTNSALFLFTSELPSTVMFLFYENVH